MDRAGLSPRAGRNSRHELPASANGDLYITQLAVSLLISLTGSVDVGQNARSRLPLRIRVAPSEGAF